MRVLKHSAIMNCRPDWVEIRIQLITQRMGGNAALVRSLIIAHGDLLLMSEQNLTDKFNLLDSFIDPPAYQQPHMVSKLAMALTRSYSESLMPRVKAIKDAGVGFARDDTTVLDFLIRTESTFARLLNSRTHSPLFLASRSLASALVREAPQPDSLGVHPNLLFPDGKLNDGVFHCIKQQLANDQFQFSRYTASPLSDEPSARADNPVIDRFLLEKSAYSRAVLMRRQSPMWTYLPIPEIPHKE